MISFLFCHVFGLRNCILLTIFTVRWLTLQKLEGFTILTFELGQSSHIINTFLILLFLRRCHFQIYINASVILKNSYIKKLHFRRSSLVSYDIFRTGLLATHVVLADDLMPAGAMLVATDINKLYQGL